MHVLVAVDGSNGSVLALRTAVSSFPGARITVVNVISSVPLTPPIAPGAMGVASAAAWDRHLAGIPEDIEGLRESAVQIAQAVIEDADLLDHDPPVESHGEVGEAAEGILDVAESLGVDIIVVGAHDHHWWSRWFSPSVGEHVTRDSPVPVLVVPVPNPN